jgi:hypothetical protein
LIKARNRKLSMLLVLAMLMTMFVGVGTASAASVEWEADNLPSYSTSSTKTVNVPANVVLSIDKTGMMNTDEENLITFTLPKGVEFVLAADVTGTKLESDVVADVYEGDFTAEAKIKSKSAVDIFVTRTGPGEGTITFSFENLLVKSGSGDLTVTMMAPAGSRFSSGSLKIATISGKGSVAVQAGTKVTFGDQGGYIDGITIAEMSAGTLDNEDEITFKLPKGFAWDDSEAIIIGGGWGFEGFKSTEGDYDYDITNDGRELVVTILHDCDADMAGRITVGTDGGTGLGVGYPFIKVEDNAKFGDITVAVSSTNDKGPDADIVVATYGDYGIKVVEGTTEEVYAGRHEQELGKFYIEEGIAGSMVANRTIYLELPKGVKWEKYPTVEAEDGSDILDGDWTIVSNTSSRKIKTTVTDFSEEASKLVFKKMEVKIAPSFEGPIDITVSGNAGAEGTVTVAECIKPITLKAENPTKVEIGAMNQKVGDILIIENIDEAILDGEYNQIEITLPRGIYFASEPKVEVEEGDLEIDDVDLIDSDFNKDGALLITIDYASSKKSTIRISDVFLTVDRTVPEGKVLAKFEGAKLDKNDEFTGEGSTAFVDWETDESLGSLEIATTITPSEGGYAKFVIGSNIYQIGAVPYVMDAVPYIKDSRSYVPMRYLAEMLGAEVTWEQADQTVTMTNGEITVVFTIGSTSYTVNGEALTADVAPEIVNDRAYLPARFVAEAFGAQVGWDAGLQTVLIQR